MNVWNNYIRRQLYNEKLIPVQGITMNQIITNVHNVHLYM